ncbi:MAG: PQQ-dependent sugar dehydrogenase [Actinomycetes bacterium]
MPARRRVATLVATACVSTLLVGGCSGDDETAPSPAAPAPSASPSPAEPEPTASGPATPTAPGGPRVTGTVAEGLDVPWGLDFLPSGDALVTERATGRVLRVSPDGTTRAVGRVPGVVPNGEGGLLGLAVSPEFAQDRAVYVYFTASADNRIVRFTLDGDGFTHGEVILDGIANASFHDGGRLAFGPDGMLYAGTGDAGVSSRAQDRDSLNGKILRMEPDGSVPADNPFADSLVYSFGHRNVQGLAFDPDGRLWAAEFGQNTWDELNLIRPGRNYGWPEVEGRADTRGGEFTNPVRQWSTAEASPSGVAYLGGVVYMAALGGERLWQVPVDGERAGRPRATFTQRYGRLRTVVAAPDGSLWLTTSNQDGRGDPQESDDRILRVVVR